MVRSIPVGVSKEIRWKKSKVGVCDHFEPSVSFETWHKAVSSNMRSKPNANFFVKHSSEEKFSFEVYSHTKNSLKLDQIQIKFATSSNWSKTSEKVSYLRLMCHLQKPYADFYET